MLICLIKSYLSNVYACGIRMHLIMNKIVFCLNRPHESRMRSTSNISQFDRLMRSGDEGYSFAKQYSDEMRSDASM